MKTRSGSIARHTVLICGITATILFCTFYPFLPGRYDGLAVTLSGMAQFLGVGGLLNIPVGVLWMAAELRKRARRESNIPSRDWGYFLGLASLIVTSLVVGVACLIAMTTLGFSIGFASLGLWALAMGRLIQRLKLPRPAPPESCNPAPFYLVGVPVAVLLLQLAFMDPATEFSRNFAMAQSAELIQEIEQYHAANGRYPESLAALHQDYKPAIVGIERYNYAPHGGAYRLYFELPTFMVRTPGAQEIVMYNTRGEHDLPGHDSDILRWTPEQLAARHGWHAVHNASSAHWKYFWFD